MRKICVRKTVSTREWWWKGEESLAHLLLLPLLLQADLHLARTVEVLAERLFDDDAVDAALRVVVLLEVGGDDGKDRGGKGHVEDAVLGRVLVRVSLLRLLDLLLKQLEALVLVVLARNVGASLEELLELLLHRGNRRLDVLGDLALEVLWAATTFQFRSECGKRCCDDIVPITAATSPPRAEPTRHPGGSGQAVTGLAQHKWTVHAHAGSAERG